MEILIKFEEIFIDNIHQFLIFNENFLIIVFKNNIYIINLSINLIEPLIFNNDYILGTNIIDSKLFIHLYHNNLKIYNLK